MAQDLKARVEELHLETLDTVLAINEITEWKVATTNSVKILGVLISQQDSLIQELIEREEKLIEALKFISNLPDVVPEWYIGLNEAVNRAKTTLADLGIE